LSKDFTANIIHVYCLKEERQRSYKEASINFTSKEGVALLDILPIFIPREAQPPSITTIHRLMKSKSMWAILPRAAVIVGGFQLVTPAVPFIIAVSSFDIRR
jgi:hypothetical protein